MSGGLDSILVARVLLAQGIEVTAVSFKSLFFDTEKAKKAAASLGISLLEIDFTEEHLAMVKKPKYGYGKNMNPCIDCHAMMFRKAGGLLISPPQPLPRGEYPPQSSDGHRREFIFDFIATGEVLGQRPMSQNAQALKTVAEYAGLADSLVRPLSAKLLEETKPEKEGLVDRSKLLDISGRGRERQMELAKGFGVVEYPSPGGGCLLTDPEFGKRLAELFGNVPECDSSDVELVKSGRVFWFNGEKGKILAVVGRDKEECNKLILLKKDNDLLIELKDEMGPVSLVRAYGFKLANIKENITISSPVKIPNILLEKRENFAIIELIAQLVGYYAPKTRGREVNIAIS